MTPSLANWRARIGRHWVALLVFSLVATLLIVYAPTARLGFVTDDFIEVGVRHFDALDSLARGDLGLFAQRFVYRSFVDPVTDWPIVRPVRQWLLWSDYLVWGLDPLGYHLTNLLLHLLTSFAVALIAWRMSRQRWTAVLAGVVFAAAPIHIAPVDSISSRGHVMAGLFLAASLFFYLLPGRRATVISLFTFALGLGSKETAVILPALLLLYEAVAGELMRNWRRTVARQAPYWGVTAGYFLLRLVSIGEVVGSPYPLGRSDWETLVAGYVQRAFMPFVTSLDTTSILLGIAVYLFAGLMYRSRPAVRFGLLWVVVSLLPTLTFRPTDRYFYTPSVGIALGLASVLSNPIPSLARWSRGVGAICAAAVLAGYFLAAPPLFEEDLAGSNAVTQFQHAVQMLYPEFPPDAHVIVAGLPGAAREGHMFNNPRQPQYALQLAYGDGSLRVTPVDHFPLDLSERGPTFFIEYDNGQVFDRADLLQAVGARRTCSSPDITWSFASGAEGWEPWNEISGWRVENGSLSFRTTGADPFLGSPVVEIPHDRLGAVEIEMTVRAPTPELGGEFYWQTELMADFSPALKTDFVIHSDGQAHVYRIEFPPNAGADGDAPIVRLRLDPGDSPARVAIDLIRIECLP